MLNSVSSISELCFITMVISPILCHSSLSTTTEKWGSCISNKICINKAAFITKRAVQIHCLYVITSPQTLFGREVLFYSCESVILSVVLSVVLFICYSVINITQKVLERYLYNFAGRFVFKKGRSRSNLTNNDDYFVISI